MSARRVAAAGVALGAALALGAAPAVAAVVPPPSGGSPDDGALPIVLVLGVNRSLDPELPVLSYADDDAVQYAELFRSLGSKTQLLARIDSDTRRVAPDAVAMAHEPRRAELARAVAALAADVAAARARHQRTTFYFVYAGHGNLDGDTAYLALEDVRLDSIYIEHEIVDKIHADESHLIIDACYSSYLVRGTGGSRRVARGFLATETSGLAQRPDIGVLVSTTAAHESHEWAGFQAGIFSHEVRSGMSGAADLNGDRRISYVEIASFVTRANQAIENERFRPKIQMHAPQGGSPLIDLRAASGRRLRLDAAAPEYHYLVEDDLGRRLVDFHNATGHEVVVLLPGGRRDLYLRRVEQNAQEFAIPSTPDVVNVADLSPQPPRVKSMGATDRAFRLIFSLPFDDQAIADYQRTALALDLEVDRVATRPTPAWLKATSTAAFAVAIASGIMAIGLTVEAGQLSNKASNPSISQLETDRLNRTANSRYRLAEIVAGVGGVAALTGGWLVYSRRTSVHPAGAFDGSSGTVGLAGGF